MPRLVVLAEQLLAPVPGGTGRYTAQLLTALARTAPPGWSVRGAVARHADLTAAVLPGLEPPRVLPLPRRALVAAWERGVPLWPGGDAVHCPTPLAPPPRRGRPLVVTVHDTVPWSHPEFLTPRGAAWHRRAVGRAARTAGALVVPTRAVAEDLVRWVTVPCPVRVIGEGATDAVVRPPQAGVADAVRARLGLPARYLLMVGTVEPRKGLDVLLAALACAAAPELPLVLVGQPGWGGVDPGALALAAGVAGERLRLLGPVPDDELAVVLHGAAMLVAPSRAEGFGLPVLEAMAAGVPVVHSDVPALVEVAGGAGVAVPVGRPRPLAEALREVAGNPARSALLVEAGRRRAAEFGWNGAARQVWELHVRLRATGRAGPA